jgi:hypothetical protein
MRQAADAWLDIAAHPRSNIATSQLARAEAQAWFAAAESADTANAIDAFNRSPVQLRSTLPS